MNSITSRLFLNSLVKKQPCLQFKMALSSSAVTTTKLSSHLQLRQVKSETSVHERRGKTKSMVLFFPWLYASRSAIDKYCNLYHDRGFDVLNVTCELHHFLWPSTAKSVAHELLNYLTSNQVPMNMDNFFVHSTSIGAYVYTIIMMELAANQDKFGSVTKKINGQVFDSLTLGGLDRMTNGIIQNASSAIARGLIKQSANLYFLLTQPWTVKLYNASIDHFKNSPIPSPILIYYSLNDPMCDADEMDKMVQLWKDRKQDVHVKCWPTSRHALHLREHPEQYISTLEAFMNRAGLESAKVVSSKL